MPDDAASRGDKMTSRAKFVFTVAQLYRDKMGYQDRAVEMCSGRDVEVKKDTDNSVA